MQIPIAIVIRWLGEMTKMEGEGATAREIVAYFDRNLDNWMDAENDGMENQFEPDVD